MLPNLIIAGVVKAGTTSLFSYLLQHPEICGSSRKETCFFLPVRYGETPLSTIEYEKYFTSCQTHRVVVESTAGYFYGAGAVASAIAETVPNARIVVCLREPVDRLVSFFRYKKSMLELPEKMTLEEYLDACEGFGADSFQDRRNDRFFGIAGGCYGDYIESWVDQFGERIRFLYFDDLKRQPEQLVRLVLQWVDVDPEPYRSFSYSVENQTTLYRSRWLQSTAIKLNYLGEPFLRRHMRIKKTLRQAYRLVNGRQDSPQYSQKLRSRMEAYFAQSNDVTRRCLLGTGQALPSWL